MKSITPSMKKNYAPGKPDVGHRPNIEDQIRVLYDRKKRLEYQMRMIMTMFKRRQEMTPEKLSEYQDLNEKLLKCTVEMANLTYIRNML